MGWLEDLAKTTVYNYKDIVGETISGTLEELQQIADRPIEGNPGESFMFEDHVYFYAGFEPKKLALTTKITFEKNGRKAVRVNHGDGKSTVRSMTRENLMKGQGVRMTGDKHDARGEKTGKKSFEVDSALTKGCREASDKVIAERTQNQVKNIRNEIAKNTAARRKK